jgi:SGNH domain (fused to AT3 domains)
MFTWALAAAVATAASFGPAVHHDGRDVAGPLDLTAVTFAQQDSQMVLALQTAKPWSAGALAASGGRALCVVVSAAPPAGQRRICVSSASGAASLTVGGADGTAIRPLDAFVSRPDGRTITATFTPLAAGLPIGPIAWQAESQWSDNGACAAPGACDDEAPDDGPVNDRIALVGQPRCFGAASRDPLHPCHDPVLRLAVIPTPDQASITPNAYCGHLVHRGLVGVCEFGATVGQATATMALVGDSHSEHWRAALEVVDQARRWHGLSITRASCPFSQAQAQLTTSHLTHQCARWNREVRAYLNANPAITTVVTSDDDATTFAGSAQSGYRAAWNALPPTVKHVIVIRDTPAITSPQAGCVAHELAAHRPAGVSCAQPRSADLLPDPAAAAARAMGGRVTAIDMTHYMCDDRICFAVVGGALIRKDGTHMTREFATSLGPFLLRAINDAVPTPNQPGAR